MIKQFWIKSLLCPVENSHAVWKSYVGSGLKDASIIRNTSQDENLDNVRFVKINSLPAVRENLTPKFYVDEVISRSVDESSLLRLDPNEKLKIDDQDSIIFKSTLTSQKTILKIPTKSYLDSFHENSRNRRDLSSLFNDQDSGLDKNCLTNLDSVSVNGNSSSESELSNRKYVEDEKYKNALPKLIKH